MNNASHSMAAGDTDNREESTARTVTACALSLLILWTLLGNFAVCAAVFQFRHLRARETNVFIASLALSDLLLAALVMPWKAAAEVAGHWPFGTFCDTWVAFDITCSTASILNLCVISVDRYWAISSPFTYERKMNKRVAFVMVTVTWTVAVVISFVPVHLNWHRADFETPGDGNGTSRDNCDSRLGRTYAITSSLVSFYIPVVIMVVTYTRIYRIAHRQIRRISILERAAEQAQSCRSGSLPCPHHNAMKVSISKETKLFKTLSVLIGVFVCCWFPFFVLNCALPFCRDAQDRGPLCVSKNTFDVFVWFGWSNSSLNPIIYAFNTDFREAFARLLGCPNAPDWTASKEPNTAMGVTFVSLDPNVAERIHDEDSQQAVSRISHHGERVNDCEADIKTAG